MSEFEQWFERKFANVDPTEYRGNTFQIGKSNMECGWNAAKQSMQGDIADLQAENEALRKDAERWNAVLHSGAYSPSDFGNPIGFAGRTGQYTKEQLNASADAYIASHREAAISKGGE